MSEKKLIVDASIEELLDTLQSNTAEPSYDQYDSVLKFIAEYNLKPGTDRVSLKALYKLYRLTYNEFSKSPFGLRMSAIFQNRTSGTFHLNRKAIDIAQEYHKLITRKNQQKRTGYVYRSTYEFFIKEMQIEPGTFYLESFVIRHLYSEWCYKKRKKRILGKVEIANFSKLYLPFKLYDPDRYAFGVNKELIKNVLTDEILQKIREKHYEKEKKQKIRKKVPSTRSSYEPKK